MPSRGPRWEQSGATRTSGPPSSAHFRTNSEGLRPSDSPTRALASRFVGSLRSRGLTRALVRLRPYRCQFEVLVVSQRIVQIELFPPASTWPVVCDLGWPEVHFT